MENPVRKATTAFRAWCADRSGAARVERTVAQSVLSVVSAWLTSIAGAPEIVQQLIIPTLMVVFTTAQAEIGKAYEADLAADIKIGGSDA